MLSRASKRRTGRSRCVNGLFRGVHRCYLEACGGAEWLGLRLKAAKSISTSVTSAVGVEEVEEGEGGNRWLLLYKENVISLLCNHLFQYVLI